MQHCQLYYYCCCCSELGCNWPYLAIVKHLNNCIEFNCIIINIIDLKGRDFLVYQSISEIIILKGNSKIRYVV